MLWILKIEIKVIWASGLKAKKLNENIAKADYVFIISGSQKRVNYLIKLYSKSSKKKLVIIMHLKRSIS
jgi:hypothetical protein